MRCYIIGNGTSLTPDQLDRIIDKPAIACNRISLIYGLTDWRPTIYVHPESLAPDIPFIQEHIDLGIECYIGEHYKGDVMVSENTHFIKDCHHHLLPFHSEELPDEWHLPQLCSFGGSVNVAMQIAAQKGYDELVLLGCDLLYKTRNRSHFSPLYEHGGEQPPFMAARNAFYGHIQAMNYIKRKHLDLKVYNATPGGMLEVWERIAL